MLTLESRLTHTIEQQSTTIHELSSTLQTLQREVAQHQTANSNLATLQERCQYLTNATDRQRQQIEHIERTLGDHSRSLENVASSMPTLGPLTKQIDGVQNSLTDIDQRIHQLTQRCDVDNTKQSDEWKEQQLRHDALSQRFEKHLHANDQASSAASTRLKHIEEAIRSLPPVDTTLPGKVNQLFIQMDRVEQAVEVLSKNSAKMMGKSPNMTTGPTKPTQKEIELEERLAAVNRRRLREKMALFFPKRTCNLICFVLILLLPSRISLHSMRAIRLAIGTVDTKITESNHLNTQLHDRMNGLDATVATQKKAHQEVMNRIKTTNAQLKEMNDQIEQLTTSDTTFDHRLTKLETDQRLKDTKEREKRKLDKEKEQAAAAASNEPSCATASNGATPVPADSSDVSEPVKTYVEERLKRERTKSKQVWKQYETAHGELANQMTAAAQRLEALESYRKKLLLDEKKRLEERIRDKEQEKSDLHAKITACQTQVDQLHQRHLTDVATLDERLTQLSASVSLASASQSGTLETQQKELASLRAIVDSKETIKRIDELREQQTSWRTELEDEIVKCKNECERVDMKGQQFGMIASECNKELTVSRDTSTKGNFVNRSFL